MGVWSLRVCGLRDVWMGVLCTGGSVNATRVFKDVTDKMLAMLPDVGEVDGECL